MKKTVLNEAVAQHKDKTRIALQTVYDSLNQGQRNKILKDENVKILFDRYGVKYEQNNLV